MWWLRGCIAPHSHTRTNARADARARAHAHTQKHINTHTRTHSPPRLLAPARVPRAPPPRAAHLHGTRGGRRLVEDARGVVAGLAGQRIRGGRGVARPAARRAAKAAAGAKTAAAAAAGGGCDARVGSRAAAREACGARRHSAAARAAAAVARRLKHDLQSLLGGLVDLGGGGEGRRSRNSILRQHATHRARTSTRTRAHAHTRRVPAAAWRRPPPIHASARTHLAVWLIALERVGRPAEVGAGLDRLAVALQRAPELGPARFGDVLHHHQHLELDRRLVALQAVCGRGRGGRGRRAGERTSVAALQPS